MLVESICSELFQVVAGFIPAWLGLWGGNAFRSGGVHLRLTGGDDLGGYKTRPYDVELW